jgi:hypothetical protein
MPIAPSGTTNLPALTVPNLYVQIVPPNPLLNGVPTDVIGIVGTASWGQLNSAVVVGSLQDQIALFGTPNPIRYDLGTAMYACSLQGASNFRCVRVSDGTDTAAVGTLIDDLLVPKVGANLTAFYTGSTGNSINATIGNGSAVGSYKLSVYMQGGIPEVYDNIVGTGNAFWKNLIDAVNLGQSIQRGPSSLVVASLPTGIAGFTINDPGSYFVVPTVTVADGTGATFEVSMLANTAVVNSGGTGYLVNDTIVLAGGTNTVPVTLTVDTVDIGGVILTATVTVAGSYTVLPSNPVSQNTTSGIGTGATFDLDWGIENINVLTAGSDYEETSVVTISDSGGADVTLFLGSISSPKLVTQTLSGGTDGSNVTSTQIIGNDGVLPRTGMYALRNNVSGGIFFLADTSDPTKWTLQDEFAREEGSYCIGSIDPGYQDNISGARTLLANAGIDSYSFSLAMGDWIQINDPFNGLTRFISPQSFKAGILANLLPSESSLNKQLSGIIATQKTLESRSYSTADLSQIRTGRIEVITNPIPSGNLFGCRLGINTSSNPLTQTDNYPRMVNFIAQTILNGMGVFIGKAQTPTVREQARATLFAFFQNLFQFGMIGDVNNPGNFSKACSIILDESNNPPNRVALGYMQSDIAVVLFSITQYFIVNLNAEQGSLSSAVSILPVQTGGL